MSKLVLGFLAMSFLFFPGCMDDGIDQGDIDLLISIDSKEINFSKKLQAESVINYSAENVSSKNVEGKEYVVSLMLKKTGEDNPELLSEKKVILKPQEKEEFIYNWKLDGVPVSDKDGDQFEIYVEVLEKVDQNKYSFIDSSEKIEVTYRIPTW